MPISNLDLSALDGTNGFRLAGVAAGDFSGYSVSSAGDVNGDGFDDLIVGAVFADPNGYESGASYVVFGKASGFASEINLSSLDGTNGFRLAGAATADLSGTSVSNAGDVNGDGFDDLIVGARYADPNGYFSGASYVVFGKASGFASSLNLSSLDGANGFRLAGVAAGDNSGRSVSAAGDVNGDGFDDLIVGAVFADPNGYESGASYVVFGKAAGFAPSVDLSSLDGANGFRLAGVAASDQSGRSVSSAGDVNGDGFDDLIVGATYASPNGYFSGASYVVFGKASGFASSVNLSLLDGTNGFRLAGVAAFDYSGFSVSAAGDVNGDGFADLIVGARGADPNGSGSGASYVVFGKASGFASSVNLSSLDGTNGFRLAGAAAGDFSGYAVSSAGDVNGDGFADLIVGARGADPNGSLSGASYVVFGKASGFASSVNLSSLDGTNGFRLAGVAADDQSGRSVSAAGDVNGDGFDDLIVGASRADPNGSYSGASYLVYGGNFNGAVSYLGLEAADSLTGNALGEVFVSGQGDDTLTGGGGADVFNAGAGDDRIVVSSTAFRLVDGGSGEDTLALSGAGQTLDLTLLANSKVNGIEVIELTGSGNSTLRLAAADLLDLSDSTNTLRVTGNGGDRVIGLEDWAGSGTTTIEGQLYHVYTRGAATLQVDADVGFAVPNLQLSSLNGANGFRLEGVAAYDRSGYSVSNAGDVNGDGFDDLIVGAFGADPNGYNSGASYVVFGKASGFAASVNLSSLDGTNGFRLAGVAAYDQTGRSVSGAGDVNGDGFADLIVGAFGADPNGSYSGASYVVFGKASGFASNLNLASLDGTSGFRLAGVAAGDNSGRSVSAAGDVNGDGFDDLIVGAFGADPNGGYSGASYVVFGKASGFAASVNLSSLDGTNGFRLAGVALNDFSGRSVSAAGDVNGDGFDDLTVGAYGADPNGSSSGASYVVFGKASGFASNLNLSALDGTNGFRLSGVAAGDVSGRSVSVAGDVNGDGFDDLIVGAFGADPNGSVSGASYVVFGKASGFASNLNLSALDGTNGFRLAGVAASDVSGFSVAAAGDVNGDGFDDLIVGAYGADPNGSSSGASYVVFGKASGFASNLNLSTLDGTNGFRLSGVAAIDRSGFSVAAAGDVNGDGFDDLIVGAYLADPNGSSSGASYVIYGGNFNGTVTHLGLEGADLLAGSALAEVFVAGQGNDTLVGGGGADVFNAGAGDDRIVVASTAFRLADGGSGTDTLALSGGGQTLDLTALANSRIQGIEVIDLTGSGHNTLKLTALDVLKLSDTTNTLRVTGNGGDRVLATDDWAHAGTASIDGQTYAVYTRGAATLQVQAGVGFATPTVQLSSLSGANGFRLDGVATYDFSGYSVSNAGDVNGDGFGDLIVGASYASPGIGYSGASYVVFGKASGFASNLNLSSLDGTNGFRLAGVAAFDRSGISVSNAGDVNGDGFADLIVGAFGADPNGESSGASYVVFGKASGFASDINLSTLDGLSGFRLAGVAAFDRSGVSVSTAGDVNGDGFDDLIVGANGANPSGGYSGATYVLFGKASGFASSVNLSSLDGTNGFRLAGVAAYDRSGRFVSNAGDVNGDGFDDLIVGAYGADPNGGYSGASYVVFGKASGFASSVNLSSLDGANGFRLAGVSAYDRSGRSVSAAGDVNGDGFDDLIVGAYGADPNGGYSGASYVVFGKASGFASSVNLSLLDGTNGFRLAGVAAYDASGVSVSTAGDVNGDGFDDLIVGARGADPNGGYSGASYVVFGKASGFASSLDLSSPDGLSGFRLAGVTVGDQSGLSVSSAGDVNGDGFDDLIVGAYRADPNGNASGASYVVYGSNITGAALHVGSAGADALSGGSGNDALRGGAGNDWLDGGAGADRMNGGAGNDTYVVDNAADRVEEDSAGGNDTVRTSLAFSLQARHELENLVLLGSANLNAVGNAKDNVLGSNAGDNVLDGGAGSDTASYAEATSAVQVSLSLPGAQATGGAGTDTLLSIENLTGSAHDDTLVGNALANVLDGGAGRDALAGADGDDLYLVDNIGDVVIENEDEGFDTVHAGASYGLAANVEALVLLGSANILATGNALANTMNGNAGSNVLNGGAGNDAIDGGAGDDSLAGNEGNDTLLGGEGNDTLGGGKDNDSLVGGNGDDSLRGLAGDDTLSGDANFDTLDGGEGNDSLLGGLQKDELYGGNGNDTLGGGNGFDTLDGGEGSDILRGALGTDVLTGGNGADRFVFATALDGLLNIDTITDFVSGTDVIELSAAIFGAYAGQIGNTVGLSANLTYNAGTGVLQYDADGAGVNPGITFAVLGTSIHPAVASDFLIVA